MSEDAPFDPFPNAKILPDNESAVRRLYSDAHGLPYHPLNSLDEAKEFDDGIVVFEGDSGGQIYLTVPARRVVCSETTLRHLLDQIDQIERPSHDGWGAEVFFERRAVGMGVPGGMKGGAVTVDLWLHPRVAERGIEAIIRDVIGGRSPEIPPTVMQRYLPAEPEDEGITLSEGSFRERMSRALTAAIEKAQPDVLEPLPNRFRLRLGLFRARGQERDATFDEAVDYLYRDGTFPGSIGVSVLGVIAGQTVLSLDPSGRHYVSRVRDDGYGAGFAPFAPSGLVPIAWKRDRSPVSHAHLAKVAAYLIGEADKRAKPAP